MLDKTVDADLVREQAKQQREEMKKNCDDKVVVASDDSFPASDPPSFNPGATGAPKTKKKNP